VSDREVRVSFAVNGQTVSVEAHPMARLLDVLRLQLHLTGTKEGCGEGECGACAVLVDGELVNSCLTPVLQVDGARVTTIEGVADGDRLHAVQEAFVAHGGAQCGICTPGMVLAAVSLIERQPHGTDEDVRRALAGNLCRCTGYVKIFEAVRRAMSGEPA
jgi:aerobic carbon-monoxide dehydrogenase small subunit